MTDASGSASWNYDSRGRLVKEAKTISGQSFVTEWGYNSADLPTWMKYPDGEVVTFGYNNSMLPVSVTGASAYAQSIAYDSASRMTQIVRGANILSTVFDYNDWNVDGGRLLNFTTTRTSDSAVLQNATYDYDSVGNILTITDSLSGPQTQTFQYDELDRVTNSAVTGGTEGLYTEAYSFETGTGNLKSKNGATYTYDATRKHAVTSLSNGNTYAYDANGNMTDRYIAAGPDAGTYEFEYDAENRMVRAEKNSALIGQFFYDADGRQVKTTVNGITTSYVGNHYEMKDGAVTKYYFAGATRLAVRHGTTLNYLLSDHLGSSSVTTDENGIQTAQAMYKAFGETRYFIGDLKTDYKFTGQREDFYLAG
ncbi:MAG: hypothetical protein HFACDABA_01988 [Anaerolineales bacterium]|nr:hypothetical protein [Anaerolineales bacterium]